MSKTVKNTHRRAMRPVTPAVRAGRVAAGTAMAAGILFGGAASATAEPGAEAIPQADSAPAAPAPGAAPVGLPAVEAADEDPEPALAPAAGSISIEVGPTAEEIAAAEAEAAEAAEAEEREAREDDSASRSNERPSAEESDTSEANDDNSEPSDDSSEPSDDSSEPSDDSSEPSDGSSESSDDSSEQTQSAPASAGKGDSILATARNGVGTPYVYGGTSSSGWDCSGFVQWVYAQHGIQLPRGAGDQAAAGTTIPRSEAQPGDLVYKPGHIGIYAGGDKFVDAGNSRVNTSERNIYSGNWTFIRVG